MTNRSLVQQVMDYLKSDPATDANGDPVPSPPLLGVLTGAAPAPGAQDARSYSGLAQGGIYPHEPKPWDARDNRGTTPVAFSAASGAIKPTMAVTPEPEVRHFQFRRIKNAVVATVVVWMYASSHNSGNIALEAMRARVDLLLNGLLFTTDQGFTAEVVRSFYFPPLDNHREFAGSKVSFLRYELTTLSGREV